MAWTPEILAAALKNARQGLSASENAQALNTAFKTDFTRSAVLGKLHRQGDQAARPKRMRRYASRAVIGTSSRAPRQTPETTAVNNAAREAGTVAPFLEQSERSCRWPVEGSGTGVLMCGQPADYLSPISTRRAYCEAHGDIATNTKWNKGRG